MSVWVFAGAVASADPGDIARAEGQADVVEDGWLWALPLVVEPLELENRLTGRACGVRLAGERR